MLKETEGAIKARLELIAYSLSGVNARKGTLNTLRKKHHIRAGMQNRWNTTKKDEQKGR